MDPKENVEDYIIYGTVNDWNELQHKKMMGLAQNNYFNQ